MNCKDCCQDCQRIGCDIEVGCSGYVEPSNGTKERMDERLAMMHKLYPDAKPTNADRLRSMSDEELSKVMTDDLCELVCSYPLTCDGDCETRMLNWLKEECES